jgi:methylthioribose-1-phosphate isomerase
MKHQGVKLKMGIESVTHIDNVRLSDDSRAVVIIDQSLLPNETKYLSLRGSEELFEAIFKLRVRGAPAIGIFAAYAVYVLSKQTTATTYDAFYREFSENKAYLDSSRPTAVNLRKALDRMDEAVKSHAGRPIPQILEAMKAEALLIHQEDMDMCLAISEYGLQLVSDGDGILTHCNAGPLATSRYGTGLGTLFLAKERGITLRAYCDETRPLLQGARLTAYELQKAGIDCTLICDNMASIVMKEGKISAVFVGCDRVAANGDTANKIGTSGVAILAKHYGIPFYVFCPSSTIDFSCKTGADIKIELRDPEEIKEKFFVKPIALPEVKCYNPAFDVTDNALITAIITEKGICKAPYTESLAAMFKKSL